ncbi:MAG: papain-like cysteine protease family protein [Xanthobacteraceae bacterium]|nr:papain-like cysteine protease family protein [Xanthobacteraceae bacterium]
MPYVSQQPYKHLCWAACGAMVLQYYQTPGSDLPDVVSKMLGSHCSVQPIPGACDSAAWPQDLYAKYGYTCQIAGGPLTPQSVQAWITNTQPVQPYFQWNDDEGNHTVLIVGWYANEPTIDLLVFDPLGGIGRQSYQMVLHAGGKGTWQDTWYNIRPTGAPQS